jgi:uncharacterized protein (UPF0548 family)
MLPATGGRFSLRLVDQDASRARFELELGTAEGSWSAQAQVSAGDGSVDWASWQGPGEPPGWLLQYARAALRSAWHQHREQGWPRRVTRWRDVPTRLAEGNDGR